MYYIYPHYYSQLYNDSQLTKMSTIKKRQHYIWMYYLKPWTNSNHIWTFFKSSDKIEQPNLMKVAQEKYFYQLEDFTEEEEAFLSKFIDYFSHNAVKDLNKSFLAYFTFPSKLKRLLDQNNNPSINKSWISEKIREIKINFMEDAHCLIEESGKKLIQHRSLDDLKTILDDDNIFDGIMFLIFQYMRTKNMKNAAFKIFKGDKNEHIIKKSWNIISFTFAMNLSKRISLDERIKFIFIENKTENHFITGDQPVFNLLGDILNDKGEVNELELYYPLTPKCAINIHFRSDQIEQFESKFAEKEQVDYLNKKVFENSDYYIFADTKKQLEEIKNNSMDSQ